MRIKFLVSFLTVLFASINAMGAGRVVLNKNKSLAEQFTQVNTTYVILHDYDLKVSNCGKTLTVPDNCVLEFDGGFLRNGTISAKRMDIVSTKKCLDKIKFVGGCSETLVIKTDYFISRYSNSVEDKTDNTDELQDCLSCGCVNIEFPQNKYLYITKTLNVTGRINLLSDGTRGFITRGQTNEALPPCVFSDKVVTLLNYAYKNASFKETIKIGSINFVVLTPYNSVNGKIDVPIVNIETAVNDNGKPSNLCGVQIDCNIKAKTYLSKYSTDKSNYKGHVPAYTALAISSSGGNISFVRITGHIDNVFRAFAFKKKPPYYFCDQVLFCDTKAGVGVDETSNADGPLRVYGSHQPIPVFDEEKPYFTSNAIMMYGFVWDLGMDTDAPAKGLKRCTIDSKLRGIRSFYNTTVEGIKEGCHYADEHMEYDIQDLAKGNRYAINILNILATDNAVQNHIFADKKAFSYIVNDNTIFSKIGGTLYNKDNLFGSIGSYNFAYGNNYTTTNEPIFKPKVDSQAYKAAVRFVIDRNYLRTIPNIIYKYPNPESGLKLIISESDETTGGFTEVYSRSFRSDEIDNDYYYSGMLSIKNPRYSKRYVKFEFEITNLYKFGDYVALPMVLMCATNLMEITQEYNGNEAWPIFFEGTNKGKTIYDENLKKPIFWNGNAWVDALGREVR